MTTLVFPYVEYPSPTFGVTLRPVVTLELYSERFHIWVRVDKCLADTGADVSVIPLPLGRFLVGDETAGRPMTVSGLSPGTQTNAFLHVIQCRLRDEMFEMPAALIETERAPIVFGRREALDRFVVRFVSGTEVILDL